MHVRGIEVVLLVPGGGGQHDVRVQAGGGHAEVQGHQQVELALAGVVAPDDFLGLLAAALAQVVAQQVVAGAEQVAQHVFVALAGRAQQVGTPDEQVAREVGRVVRVLGGETQRAAFQLIDHVIRGAFAGGAGLGGQAQWIAIQLGGRGQPAHAFGAHVVVDQAAAVLLRRRQRREDLANLELLEAPLAGMVVEERGAVHVAWRPVPVEGERQRRPAGLRAQLLLADVMRPATTALPDAPA